MKTMKSGADSLGGVLKIGYESACNSRIVNPVSEYSFIL